MTDRRLDDLLVRLWAGDLTVAETDELNRLLDADPRADAVLEAHALLSLAAADAGAAARLQPTRRRWLRTAVAAGGLLAVGTAAALTAGRSAGSARLVRVSGAVRLGGGAAAAGAELLAGQTVATVGLGASASLAFPDGTTAVLTGDTEARLPERPGRLDVVRGAVLADVPADRFELATPEAAAVASAGSRLAVSRAAGQTEVGVSAGRVTLADPGGDELAEVGGGEMATVHARGTTVRVGSAAGPDEYAWPTAGPLPVGWQKGRVDHGPDGRCLAPVRWFDPHINRTCWQVRSDARWVGGLFAVHPDTVARVKYRVDRPGVGQLLAVVHPADPRVLTDCNVLLAPLAFEPAADGGWRTAVLPLAGWAIEPHPGRPPVGPLPWVAFLVVFNTYEHDLGLRVAEFAVTRGPP
jgi:ferric-dicitrate binding protein FerR (iron transport regulator)